MALKHGFLMVNYTEKMAPLLNMRMGMKNGISMVSDIEKMDPLSKI
jgi:hypothetical protein